VSSQLHPPAALPPGKEPRYPLDRRLGGPQSRSGRCGEEKILDPTGTLSVLVSMIRGFGNDFFQSYSVKASVAIKVVVLGKVLILSLI
jgi:hypothetical protein